MDLASSLTPPAGDVNQAVVFGLLGAGGILLVHAVTGSSLADVVAGHAGTVSSSGATISGLGGSIGSALTGSGGMAGAEKMLAAAQAAVGAPYETSGHDAVDRTAAQIRQAGTDCSGFLSYLMGANGLGDWSQSYTTPDIPSRPDIKPGPGSRP